MKYKDIQKLILKDEGTFNQFYDKYHKLFFIIIYKKIKDFSTTEDLVAETFLKIYESINQYNGGSFKYWCITICKNITNMHLRKTILEREKLKELAETTKTAPKYIKDDYGESELLKDIKKIVNNETYEIIVLHLVQRLKFREIALIRNETTSSVLGKYHRGIKLIRSRLKYEDYR